MNGPESPFRKIPQYDQGPTGMCYSYAGAVLLNYHLLKQNPEAQIVDPIYMAVQSRLGEDGKIKEGVEGVDGGFIVDAINGTRKHGGCSKDLTWEALREIRKIAPYFVAEEAVLVVLDKVLKDLRDSQNVEGPPLYACSTDPLYLLILDFVEKKGLRYKLAIEAIREIFSKCLSQPILVGNLPEAKLSRQFTTEALRARLDSTLKDGFPMALSIASTVFSRPSDRCIEVDTKSNLREVKLTKHHKCRAAGKGKHFKHAIVVAGQKKVNGKCHLLVRNSWGSAWGPKNEETGKPFHCACEQYIGSLDATPIYHSICPVSGGIDPKEAANPNLPVSQRSVYFKRGCWIPKEDLIANTAGVTTMGELP